MNINRLSSFECCHAISIDELQGVSLINFNPHFILWNHR